MGRGSYTESKRVAGSWMSPRGSRVARAMDQADGNFLPREELERRLAALAERDAKVLPLFAARCALRAFPLLAMPADFDFWPQQERALNLLRIWRALLAAWAGDTVAPEVVEGARRAAETAKGFIAGGEDSSLQGEVLKWSTLVALAEQAARVGSGISVSEQVALAGIVAQTVQDFLFHIAGQGTVDVVLQELEHSESGGSEMLRAASLWLNVTPSDLLMNLAFERLPQGLQQQAKLQSSRDSIGASLLDRIVAICKMLFERGYSLPQAHEDLSALRHYFERSAPQPAAAAPVQPSPVESVSAPAAATTKASPASLHEPWDETQMVNAIPDLEIPAPATPGSSPKDETLFQEFPPKPLADESAREKTAADAPLQRELSYRPSDRHSIEQISEVDHLNRGKLVDALATVLTAPGNESHQTIGLLGDWGVGKSTLVHLLKNELVRRQDQQPFLFAEFNAWAYEHTDNLQAGIAQEMLKALSSDMPRPKKSVAPAANVPAKMRAWLQAGFSQIVWLCKRILITCQFAIALNGWRMLWLLLMLLVAVLPFTWGEVGETLVGLASESGTTSAGDALEIGR